MRETTRARKWRRKPRWRRRRRLSTAARIAGFLLLLGFVGLFIHGGVSLIGRSNALSERGVRVTGNVIDTGYRTSTDSDGHTSTTRRFKVRFTDLEGRTHEFWEDGDKKKGREVKVTYDPRNPGTATTYPPRSLAIAGGIVIAFGVVFLVFMTWMIFAPL
jgi:hypothetical protein